MRQACGAVERRLLRKCFSLLVLGRYDILHPAIAALDV